MYRLFLLPFILLTTTCISIPRRNIASIKENKTLDYTTFIELLKTHQISTVAEGLKFLSTRYPDYLRFRISIYGSESVQQASFTEPRVLIFGPDAKFVFTFNGGPHNYGGDSIEAYQFDEKTKEFNFYSILFKKEAKEIPFPNDEIEFETNQIVATKRNPSLCLGCHGQRPIPIWSTDLNWAGVYGSNDDLLFGSFHKNSYIKHGKYQYLQYLTYPRSQGRWINLPENVQDRELEGYLKFLSLTPKHERYKHLPSLAFEEGFRKYAGGTPFSSIDESEFIESTKKDVYRSELEPDRLNGFFTERVVELAWQSLFYQVDQHPSAKRLLRQIFSPQRLREAQVYYSAGRRGLFADLDNYSHWIAPLLLQEMSLRIGPLKSHLKQVILQELEMQVVRLQRIEQDLQSQVYVPDEWPADQNEIEEYEKFLGRQLNRLEKIAVKGESAGLPFLGLLSYVLKYSNINLKDFDTNSQIYSSRGRDRVISFYFGTNKMVDYLQSLHH